MASRKRRRGEHASATAESPAPVVQPQPQQFLYCVKNLLGQVLSISFLNEAGEQVSVKIPAHKLSRAVPMDRISSYTHGLVRRGYAKIIQDPSRVS